MDWLHEFWEFILFIYLHSNITPRWCNNLFFVIHQVTHAKSGMSMYLDWDRVRMFDKDVAQMFLNNVKNVREAK